MDLRRLAVSLVLLVPCLVAPVARSQPVRVNEYHFAVADFRGPQIDRNHWNWYGALVVEWIPVDGGDLTRYGGVFKGICERRKTPTSWSIHCEGRSPGMSDEDTFTMDPLAAEAALDVTDADGHHHIDWVATDDLYGPFLSQSPCPEGSGYGTGLARPAVAEARVYGGRYSTQANSGSWTEIWSGADVSQCNLLSERDFRDVTNGGGYSIHHSWKVAR